MPRAYAPIPPIPPAPLTNDPRLRGDNVQLSDYLPPKRQPGPDAVSACSEKSVSRGTPRSSSNISTNTLKSLARHREIDQYYKMRKPELCSSLFSAPDKEIIHSQRHWLRYYNDLPASENSLNECKQTTTKDKASTKTLLQVARRRGLVVKSDMIRPRVCDLLYSGGPLPAAPLAPLPPRVEEPIRPESAVLVTIPVPNYWLRFSIDPTKRTSESLQHFVFFIKSKNNSSIGHFVVVYPMYKAFPFLVKKQWDSKLNEMVRLQNRSSVPWLQNYSVLNSEDALQSYLLLNSLSEEGTVKVLQSLPFSSQQNVFMGSYADAETQKIVARWNLEECQSLVNAAIQLQNEFFTLDSSVAESPLQLVLLQNIQFTNNSPFIITAKSQTFTITTLAPLDSNVKNLHRRLETLFQYNPAARNLPEMVGLRRGGK